MLSSISRPPARWRQLEDLAAQDYDQVAGRADRAPKPSPKQSTRSSRTPRKSCYAFSRNADGSLDRTSTVYPALAWWSGLAYAGERRRILHRKPEHCLQQLASHALNTDWGLRDVANDEKIYDGMSYHQGSVWPLFTGWAALAEYRGNQPLAGYQLLMENANLTKAQDLGSVTELLSGDYFVPFGRSTSHQLWSSAMVITPTLRGLFGIDIDAQTKTITVNPHLPAGWDAAEVRNLPLPGGTETLHFNRSANDVVVSLTNVNHSDWRIRSDIEQARPVKSDEPSISIPLPAIEVDPLLTGFRSNVPDDHMLIDRPPIPGAENGRFRITRSVYGDHKLTLTCEGLAGNQEIASLLRHGTFTPKADVSNVDQGAKAIISVKDGWAFKDEKAPLLLVLNFPPGEGWKTITVTLTW